MITVTVQSTIPAPIEQVYDWLTDAAHYRDVPGVLRARRIDGPGPANELGAVREIVTIGMRLREEVLATDRPVSFEYRLIKTFPPLRHELGVMSFQPGDDGTRVRWTSRFEVASPVLSGLLTRLIAPMIAIGFRQVLTQARRRASAPS
jgi:uncharacterized protein YndB with AHSA1/START domain